MSPQPVTREAGRELDALVAEQVMGFVRVTHNWNNVATLSVAERENGTQVFLRPYSTDIAAAWQVVTKMRDFSPRYASLTMTAYSYNRTYATFDAEAINDYSPDTWVEANGEHATPLAICLAALKAVGHP